MKKIIFLFFQIFRISECHKYILLLGVALLNNILERSNFNIFENQQVELEHGPYKM